MIVLMERRISRQKVASGEPEPAASGMLNLKSCTQGARSNAMPKQLYYGMSLISGSSHCLPTAKTDEICGFSRTLFCPANGGVSDSAEIPKVFRVVGCRTARCIRKMTKTRTPPLTHPPLGDALLLQFSHHLLLAIFRDVQWAQWGNWSSSPYEQICAWVSLSRWGAIGTELSKMGNSWTAIHSRL